MPALSVFVLGGSALATAGLAGSTMFTGLTADATPSTGANQDRLSVTCSRLPNRIERIERVQERLNADADTPGSFAYLQARIDKNRQAGHDDAVRLLEDRMAIRKDVAALLPDVLTHLKDAQQVCTDHGMGS
jgi:hypothetical protein